MRLFDTHAHINDDKFELDQTEMLQTCFSVGVEYILCPGCDRATSESAVALADTYSQVYAAVGLHPEEVKSVEEEDFDYFEYMAKTHPKVVAIGEIGLDYYWDTSTKDLQKTCFIRQMKIAQRVDKPIIIHDREAHGDIIDILRTYGKDNRGIFHCYSGSYEMALEAIKMDFYISFAGPVVFPKSTNLKEIATKIPLNRLLIETDSPYLTPPPFRGKRNDPSKTQFVCEEIAKLKGISAEELATITLDNGKRIFNIK